MLLKQRRLALTASERGAKSQVIREGLSGAIDWSSVRTVHYFEPIERLGEVDLTNFMDSLQERNIKMYTSRKIRDKWQTVGPDDEPVSEMPEFDVIIVPMLGFDPSTLHRIGYGGGHYDRFLAGQPQARKIGVCFEAGKVGHIPTEAHDVPLERIITEAHTYTS